MPSEESRKTARILLNQIDATFPWNASVDLIAAALDEAKAERTNDIRTIIQDFPRQGIAESSRAALLESLTKGPSQ